MAQRFEELLPAAERKQVKLEYLEKKYKLLAFIVMAEKKLQTWTVKYKTKETVVELLEIYTVSRSKFDWEGEIVCSIRSD